MYFSLSEMRIIRYIAFLFCLTLVFSCTKPEDDSPQNRVPSSVTEEPFPDFSIDSENDLQENNQGPKPVFINDDGDDESGPSGVGNRK